MAPVEVLKLVAALRRLVHREGAPTPRAFADVLDELVPELRFHRGDAGLWLVRVGLELVDRGGLGPSLVLAMEHFGACDDCQRAVWCREGLGLLAGFPREELLAVWCAVTGRVFRPMPAGSGDEGAPDGDRRRLPYPGTGRN